MSDEMSDVRDCRGGGWTRFGPSRCRDSQPALAREFVNNADHGVDGDGDGEGDGEGYSDDDTRYTHTIHTMYILRDTHTHTHMAMILEKSVTSPKLVCLNWLCRGPCTCPPPLTRSSRPSFTAVHNRHAAPQRRQRHRLLAYYSCTEHPDAA